MTDDPTKYFEKGKLPEVIYVPADGRYSMSYVVGNGELVKYIREDIADPDKLHAEIEVLRTGIKKLSGMLIDAIKKVLAGVEG